MLLLLLLLFTKELQVFFIIKPDIVALLCIFNANKLKYTNMFSV